MTDFDRVIKGLTILKKYKPKGTTAAEHDSFYADGPPAEKMTKEDVKALEKADWFWDEDTTGWMMFT